MDRILMVGRSSAGSSGLGWVGWVVGVVVVGALVAEVVGALVGSLVAPVVGASVPAVVPSVASVSLPAVVPSVSAGMVVVVVSPSSAEVPAVVPASVAAVVAPALLSSFLAVSSLPQAHRPSSMVIASRKARNFFMFILLLFCSYHARVASLNWCSSSWVNSGASLSVGATVTMGKVSPSPGNTITVVMVLPAASVL